MRTARRSRPRWPNRHRCAVVFTFDLDAESIWIDMDPDNRSRPVLMSLSRYGMTLGLSRLLRLLDRHGVKATFFVPGRTAEDYPEAVSRLHREGHEVAHHNYMHESPRRLAAAEERAVLDKGTSILTSLTGVRPLGWRAPYWEPGPRSLRLIHEMGFVYASNMMDSELPYRHRIHGKTTSLVEIPVHWMLDDWTYWSYRARLDKACSPASVYEVWAGEFDCFHRDGGCFVLTMDPQISGRPSTVEMLGRLIRHMRGRSGVWFARCIDVANHWLKSS